MERKSPIVLAINHRPGSFSDRWTQKCEERQIKYRFVRGCDTNIIRLLSGVNAFLWHWVNGAPEDFICARRIIEAADYLNIKIFPNRLTCWFYDDKIAEKYVLEAVESPLVTTYIFFNLPEVLEWIDSAVFPKVFKLSRGAGSSNVRLVRTAKEARKLAKVAFGGGFNSCSWIVGDFRTKLHRHRNKKDILEVIKRMPASLSHIVRYNHLVGREIGYIYFQDFLPGNQFDTRITVIGDRAFGFRRRVRPNDFRASGSGDIDFDRRFVHPDCLKIAFETAAKLRSQSIAFDFAFDAEGKPKILEISYCYDPGVVYECSGHWDRQFNWVEGHLWPQDAILDDVLKELSS